MRCDSAVFVTLNEMSGGSSETLVNEPMVMPRTSCPSVIVTTTTGDGRRRIVSRKVVASTGSDIDSVRVAGKETVGVSDMGPPVIMRLREYRPKYRNVPVATVIFRCSIP